MSDLESRNRFVFCEKCVDFIYDHTLDRLRGPSGKFEAIGESQAIPNYPTYGHLLTSGRWAIHLG